MIRLALLLLVCWAVFALGAHWGAGREREVAAAQRMPAPAATPTPHPAIRCVKVCFRWHPFSEQRMPTPAATPTLRPATRCVNGDPPREWTQQEAEARYHTASQWLRTAEEHGVWNDRGRRAVMLAVGQLIEVVLCAPN